MSPRPSLILAIESAISGGSISLIQGNSELARWIGTASAAKSEELLEHIDQLLRAKELAKDAIDMVAVSAGPGSFTGIRVGIATALGLKIGLGIPMLSIPLLRAMVLATEGTDNVETVAAVPVGRDQVCFQSFRLAGRTATESGEPRSKPTEEFARYVKEGSDRRFVLHGQLCERSGGLPNVTNFGSDLAYAIGLVSRLDPSSAITKPLFVSKTS